MSKIDKRIVQMQFDNQQFENGVRTSIKSLDGLKKGLDLKDASKGLDNLDKAGRNFSLSGISDSVSMVASRFTTLGIMGVTALQNITNQAVNAGKRIAHALTIAPIKDGFNEYEIKMGSIQTIMAGTGESLEAVSGYLNELNLYADRTIYSFSDMTSNIGKFTNSGVKLKDAVAAIQGVSNVAAVSGANTWEASRAMYNFAQALSAGHVKLIDWKSIEVANMATVEFKTQLLETAVAHGTLTKASNGMYKTLKGNTFGATKEFNEYLKDQWMTTDVLVDTLGDYADETTEIGKKAFAAAQDIKTFRQLYDTLTEAAGSGWAETWELVFGDFEEAKAFFGDVNDLLGGILETSAKARNELLFSGLSTGWKQFIDEGGIEARTYRESVIEVAKSHGIAIDEMIEKDGSFEKTLKNGWMTSEILTESVTKLTDKTKNLSEKQLEEMGITKKQVKALEAFQSRIEGGRVPLDEFVESMSKASGRENLLEAMFSAFDGIRSVLTPIKEAFREVFGFVTGDQIRELTERIRDFFEKFKMGEEASENLKSAFKGVFGILDLFKQGIMSLIGLGSRLVKILVPMGGGLLSAAGSMGEWVYSVTEAIKKSGFITITFDIIGKAIEKLSEGIKKSIQFIKNLFQSVEDSDVDVFGQLADKIKTRLEPLSKIGDFLKDVISKIISGVKKVIPFIYEISSRVGATIGDMFSGLIEGGGFKGTFDLLNSGLLAAIYFGIKKFIDSLTSITDNAGGFLGSMTGILDGVRGSLEAFQSQLKSKTLMKIAGAIAILSIALVILASIDSTKLTTSLVAISVLFAELFASMSIFQKTMTGKGFKSMGKVVVGMIGMSVAVLILATAMKTLSSLDWGGVIRGLVAVAVLTQVLTKAAKSLSGQQAAVIKGALGLIGFAIAINILARAVKTMGELDVGSLTKGLVGVVALMVALSLFMKFTKMDGIDLKKGLGFVALAGAVALLANSVSSLGSMPIEGILQGMMGIGAILAMLVAFIKMTGESYDLIATAFAMDLLGIAISMFANVVIRLSKIKIEDMGKGLLGLALILAMVVIAIKTLPEATELIATGVGMIAIAVALLILSKAVQSLGQMSMGELAKGLIAMGLALAILVVAMKFMTSAIVGAFALLVVAGALVVLAAALRIMGAMSVGEIAKALITLVLLFTILGVSAIVLTPLIPIILALAAAIALLGAGILAIGTGLVLFAVGMTALIALGTAGVAAIISFVTSILGLIPVFLSQIAAGIIAFAKTIGDGAPVIGEAVKNVLLAIIDVIRVVTPEVIDTLIELTVHMAQALADAIPLLVTAGMDLIIGILTGIAEKIDDVVAAAIDIVLQFIRGVESKLPEVIDTAFKLMITFINGLADAIENNHEAIAEAIEKLISSISTAVTNMSGTIKNIGKDIIKGMIKGVGEKAGDLASSALTAVKRAVNAVSNYLGINSPSRLFMRIGEDTGEGMILGIEGISGKVSKSTENMGRSAVETIQNALSGVSDSSGLNPSIRPVLDMSNVNNGLSDRLNLAEDLQRMTQGTIDLQEVRKTEEKVTMKHTFDKLVVEGVNDKGEFVASADYAVEDVIASLMRKQVRV